MCIVVLAFVFGTNRIIKEKTQWREFRFARFLSATARERKYTKLKIIYRLLAKSCDYSTNTHALHNNSENENCYSLSSVDKKKSQDFFFNGLHAKVQQNNEI